MKTRTLFLTLGTLTAAMSALSAQTAPPPDPAAALTASARLNKAELDQLLGPIALYPDALIAMILPASTVPGDIVLGARYIKANGDPNAVDTLPWDDSVKSLTHYPEVLTWLDENLEWTTALGEAFVVQPEDVMKSIQDLRALAKANGNLVNTPQQDVVVQDELIRIVPADPEIIYVPQYDPAVVYVQSYAPAYGIGASFISFGIGFGVGSWLAYDCDWRRRCVYRGDWCGWNRGNTVIANNTINRNTNINVVNINANKATQWRPSARSVRQVAQWQRNGEGNSRWIETGRKHLQTRRDDRNPATGLPRPAKFNADSRSEQMKQFATARAQNRVTKAPEVQHPTGTQNIGVPRVPKVSPPTSAPKVEGQDVTPPRSLADRLQNRTNRQPETTTARPAQPRQRETSQNSDQQKIRQWLKQGDTNPRPATKSPQQQPQRSQTQSSASRDQQTIRNWIQQQQQQRPQQQQQQQRQIQTQPQQRSSNAGRYTEQRSANTRNTQREPARHDLSQPKAPNPRPQQYRPQPTQQSNPQAGGGGGRFQQRLQDFRERRDR